MICKPLTSGIGAHRTFSFIFPVQWIYASRRAKSIWSEKRNQQYIFFSLSHSALEMLFPTKLSHLLRIVFVCVATITERTTFDGLKLNWIQTLPQREGQKMRWWRCFLYTETKRGGESVAKERGQPEPVLHARGLLWEKELTGRRSAASSFQTTAAQKEETSWGCCDTSRSFSIPLFTCLPLPLTELIYATHMCNTLTHIPLSMTHTISEHVHWGFIRNWQAACAQQRELKINQVKLNFWGNLCS